MTALTTTDALIDQFLAKAETAPPPAHKQLVFAIDATASRERSWDAAIRDQAAMFQAAARLGGLEVQLVYYRGIEELKATGWFAHSAPLVNAMTKVMCRGGPTQIGRVLKHVADEHARQPVAAAVLVGDTCEEPPEAIHVCALALGRLKIPVYAFLEGQCPVGRQAFGWIADLTKGAVLPFDVSSAGRLRELLGAVAAYVTGGIEALADQKPEIVRC